MQPTLTTQELLDLYKVAIEEYRFQVKLNNDRLLHYTVFNVAVLSAGAGLLKVGSARVESLIVTTIFLAGFCTSLIGALAVGTFHRYYRRTVYRKTVYEELLGLTEERELPNGLKADLAIGTTDSHAERQRILTQTEEWVCRPIDTWSVVGGFRLTLSILTGLHLLGAVAAVVLTVRAHN